MTTLGAKPNHGFFNCQHPATGNSRAPVRCARRSRPAARACAYRHGCGRRAQASVPWNQNIFFSAVSCFTRETSVRCRRLRHRRDRHPGVRWNGSERQLHFFSSGGRFSAPHNPDCAKLRKPIGGVRRRSTRAGATTTRILGRRIGATGGIREARSKRAMIGISSPCRFRADVRIPNRIDDRRYVSVLRVGGAWWRSPAGSATDERHDAHDASACRKRRSRPRSRGRLPDAPGLARCRDAISARRLRAARRSRPDRAGR